MIETRVIDALRELNKHPYVMDLDGPVLSQELVDANVFMKNVAFGEELLTEHTVSPIDILIGDDVSGRVSTLTAHRLLRLAQSDGRIQRAPKTHFMASGNIPAEINTENNQIETLWRQNLQKHAQKLIGENTVKRVVVVTEGSFSGQSINRLKSAFSQIGVENVNHIVGASVYLNKEGTKSSDRPIVGIEKYPPAPTSSRHPDFNGTRSAELRYFLDDYALALYTIIKNAEPSIVDVDDIEDRGGY